MLEKISFREASAEDCRMFYDWRNDPGVRDVSFDKSDISYEDHIKWFKNKIDSEACRLFVMMIGQDPIGQVRFDIEGGEAVISISIDKNFRGRSLGPKAIKVLSDSMVKGGEAGKVIAYIKKDNRASFNAFVKAGYVSSGDKRIIKGYSADRLEYGA